MAELGLAAVQTAPGWDRDRNVKQAEQRVREAAGQGASIVLLPELFETPYFCADEDRALFELARPFDGNPMIARMSELAAELGVVLPLSFFEKAEAGFYNALAMVDADGQVLGRYRKSHIPEGPGYHETFYFNPGDTGFKVWETRFGRVGAAVCWDQWYPECARALVLAGAELLLYPSAIGNEPHLPGYDSKDHWQRVMQGSAAANMVPLAASNRTGHEQHRDASLTFYGSSFIANPYGAIVAEAPRDSETTIIACFDLDAIAAARRDWGLFRDRRPALYQALTKR